MTELGFRLLTQGGKVSIRGCPLPIYNYYRLFLLSGFSAVRLLL